MEKAIVNVEIFWVIVAVSRTWDNMVRQSRIKLEERMAPFEIRTETNPKDQKKGDLRLDRNS